jgi:hypothetical protein
MPSDVTQAGKQYEQENTMGENAKRFEFLERKINKSIKKIKNKKTVYENLVWCHHNLNVYG